MTRDGLRKETDKMKRIIKPRIFFYISGNLASQSMELVFNFLKKSNKYHLDIFTDNYLPEINYFLKSNANLIKSFNQKHLNKLMKNYNLIITSIRSPGHEERSLIIASNKLKIPSIVLLADIGTGAKKFNQNNKIILPDIIAVPDNITYKILLANKIPEKVLVKVGSPYFDNISSKNYIIKNSLNKKIGFFSIPNSLDFKNWKIRPKYKESDVIKGLIWASSKLNLDVSLRLHPKEYHESQKYLKFLSNKLNLEQVNKDKNLINFINKNSIFVSTYSTGILVARLLGKPSISFQPTNQKPIRKELYKEYDIPIINTKEKLYLTLKIC